ncbi:hypothetical protein SAMN05192568_10636 [Methylobacterium pseudosasicola]|uniref:Uncharacterized protein n=1 Tax=Methylobacterium pseudosasicola TaxID=582667 RepID=A0A1I4U448_9HYPH|nr:hypothetical protein SAMN05192568_10636 [Methylobacterium pseudosasicola]
MDWTRPEVISAAALAVSGLSFAVSAFTAWRAVAADRPRVWLVLEPTEAPDCWVGNIHVQSGSRVGVTGHSVRLARISVASARNQSLLLGPSRRVIWIGEDGGTRISSDDAEQCSALKIPVHEDPTSMVPRGEHGVIRVVVYRPALSRSESVTLVVTLQSLSGRPSYRDHTIHSDIPGSGIGFVLGR